MENQDPNNQSTSESKSLDFQSLITSLQKLYEHYCQYGERLNSTILKSHKFIKISKESGLMSNILNKTRLEIIYKSENKYNRMNFEQFLNSLIKIAEIKYSSSNESRRSKVKRLLNEYFIPLYYSIFPDNPSYDKDPSFESFLYSSICEEILTALSPILFDIYRVYFPHEISISEDIRYVQEHSLKQFFIFIKEFEIAPGLLSKSLCYNVYQSETVKEESSESITKNNDFYFRIVKRIDIASYSKYDPHNKNILGNYFNFFKFIRTIIKLSELTFRKVDFKKISSAEKLILFCQKMEVSEGFLHFELKSNKTHSEKNSALLKPELIDKIMASLEQMKEDDEIKEEQWDENENENNDLNNDNEYNNSKHMKITSSNVNSNVNYYGNEGNPQVTNTNYLMTDNYETEYTNYLNEVYGTDLLQIFKGICNCGDQFNFKYMKSKAFYKFLTESNLILISGKNTCGLKMNEIDTLFTKLSLLHRSINSEHVDPLIETSPSNLSLMITSRRNLFTSKDTHSKSSQSKFEFDVFLIGIEIIAKAVYPYMSTKDAIDKVVNEHIFANLQGVYNNKIKSIEDKVEILKELQASDEYIKVLELTHKAVTPIFKFYTKSSNGLMTFKMFLQFAQDFELFPTVMSKVKLNAFFGAIGQYSSYSAQDGSCVIEQSLFVDILALCANEIVFPEPEPTPVEKMLILMEKLCQSEGREKIIKNTGNNRMTAEDTLNLLEEFKERYPEFFEMKEQRKEDFMELMAGETVEE